MTTRAHITLVVDRSGSMQAVKDEAESGIRHFVDEQRKLVDKGEAKIKLSLYQFDNEYEHVFGPIKIADAPEYVLEPRSMTALYDAIGKSIEDTKAVIDNAKKTPDKVVLVIMTDGKENASREHTFDSVTRLVNDRQAAGWQILFLAGDLNAAAMGIAAGIQTRSFDPSQRGETRATYDVATASVSNYVSGLSDKVDAGDSQDKQD